MAVYLDHAATTPMRAEAREAWLAASETAGNPSSIHGAGQAARRVLEDARERLAAAVDADPVEIVFTSGGTESINLALRGIWAAAEPGSGDRVVTTAAEHHATLETVAALEREGAQVARVPVDADAVVDLAAWSDAVSAPDVRVASLLAANNEVGTIQPLADALDAAGGHGVPVHVDAVGAFGHVPVSFRALRGTSAGGGLAALSIAAHKIGGPVGVGALVVARDASLRPLLHGGANQRGLRAGTQDAAGAAAFAVAAELAVAELDREAVRIRSLRDRLEQGILAAVPEVRVSGGGRERLPGTLHIVFPGAQGDSMLLLLDMAGVAVSTGSACQAGVPEPSHVVLAMGGGADAARSALRFTLGRTTTEADVDAALAVVPTAYERARRAGMSSRPVR